MVLYVIGLGLGDESDITVKGLEAVKSSARVFLEAYTSILGVSKEKLEAYYSKSVTIADRECVESGCDVILDGADTENVAFLVVGDPFGATTHSDLILRARSRKIPVKVIHNASIMNAIGCCGLQLYSYGQSVSICFWTDTWKPDSFYEKIEFNRKGGLHTLCLLDIKVKEPDFEALIRGKKVYEPPRFMTVNQAAEILLKVAESRSELAYGPDTLCVGLARVGQETQTIISGTLRQLLDADFGPPLHALVISGNMHFLEAEMVATFAVNPDDFKPFMEESHH